MTSKNRPSRTGLRFVGMLRNAIEMDESGGPATLTHHLAAAPPWGGPPMSFMVFLAAETTGAFRVTCRELPKVTASGQDEEEALTRAELAIRDALAVWPSSPGSPT